MKHTREKFLKHLIVGASSLPILIEACTKSSDAQSTGTDTTSSTGSGKDCIVSPEETAGPYPYDLSKDSAMFRVDITEGKTGIPLGLTITVVNANDNCSPVSNARVDIWHCDKDGYYSEFAEPGYLGTQDYRGKTFLRGIQLTDSNGQVKFTTIYPGWYSGRVTHIHAEVFVNNVLKKTTQMAFPDDINSTVYKTSLYSSHGQNASVANNAADNIFADSLDDELLTLSGDTTNGFTGTFTISIEA